MSFHDNLKKFRELAGYSSAKDFANLLEIPYTTYLGYESKGIEPKYDTLINIANKLGITTDELLGHKLNAYKYCKHLVDYGEKYELHEDDKRIIIKIIDEDLFDGSEYVVADIVFNSSKDFIEAVTKAKNSFDNSRAKQELWSTYLYKHLIKTYFNHSKNENSFDFVLD